MSSFFEISRFFHKKSQLFFSVYLRSLILSVGCILFKFIFFFLKMKEKQK